MHKAGKILALVGTIIMTIMNVWVSFIYMGASGFWGGYAIGVLINCVIIWTCYMLSGKKGWTITGLVFATLSFNILAIIGYALMLGGWSSREGASVDAVPEA